MHALFAVDWHNEMLSSTCVAWSYPVMRDLHDRNVG